MAKLSISVVIPSHNRQDILKRVLEHLANGSHRPDEVLVIDDGSTPPVSEVLDLQPIGLPNIRVIRHETGRGAAAARNAGARAAKGDILHFVDDDVFPDFHCLRYHHQIHTHHPEPEYAVMGRLYFDPDLTRTPVMHYLEESGGFSAVAKGEDGEFQRRGLISANFSIKSAFLRDKAELFDEEFPYSQNEDTEFGVRMICQGLNLHYRIAPSARHHSTFDLDNFFHKVWQAGVSKAYWEQKDPDKNNFSDSLKRVVMSKSREEHYDRLFKEYIETFGQDSLGNHINQWDSATYDSFKFYMDKFVAWKADMGIYDGWERIIPNFAEIAADILKAYTHKKAKKRIKLLQSAHNRNKNFLPAALLLSDELRLDTQFKQTCALLEGLGDSYPVISRLYQAYNYLGENFKSIELAKRVYDEAVFPTAIIMGHRHKAARHLMRLCKHQQLSDSWLTEAIFSVTPDEYNQLTDWVHWLGNNLANFGKPFPTNAAVSEMYARKVTLDQLEVQMDETYGRVDGFLKRGNESVARKPQALPKEVAKKVKKNDIRGTVSWYSSEKRFGFIQPDKGSSIAFLHESNLTSPVKNPLVPGTAVTYVPRETPLGLEAQNITAL